MLRFLDRVDQSISTGELDYTDLTVPQVSPFFTRKKGWVAGAAAFLFFCDVIGTHITCGS